MEIICIGCPVGCDLTVNQQGEGIAVKGHKCEKGIQYGKEELLNPTRNIATSVRVVGGDIPMLSVKTSRPIPKSAIMDTVKAIHQVTPQAPVKIGEVILADAAGTGVDIVATRHIEKTRSV